MQGDREPLLTDDVRELLRLINEHDLAEVLIERGDARVHIKRAAPHPPLVNMVAAAPQAMPTPTYPHLVAVPSSTAATPASVPSVSTEDIPPAVTGITVTAPMVGTFYAAPGPKEPPYVRVGDEVRPGDVLGIIEAMKIMNEIECEIEGMISAILVESGQAVEYGQPLMVIEPAGTSNVATPLNA